MHTALPVIVIGAGPVGLAAAAHLLQRGLTPRVLEAGATVGAGIQRWSHVRMFSPWRYTLDRAAVALLEADGRWTAPDREAYPTGGEVLERYLRPLAALPALAAVTTTGTRVVAVSRQRRDRMKDAGRHEAPFVVRYVDASGEHELLARAVIDASGTIESPNPLGASGLPALGEAQLQSRIAYGIPDVRRAQRARYAGKRVLVLGSGHSAFNVLQDLAALAQEAPDTRIVWALRRNGLARVLGGGEHDQLRERGRLGQAIGALVARGALEVATGFELERLEGTSEGIVASGGGRRLAPVDEIVGATGFRPALGLLSELRLALDAGTQAPLALAPLIDPNLHSCGSVRPHGAEELRHPEPDLYIVGMKSYGRAPTFLLLTGYEQVRSVVAAIAGDGEAARRVELQLPETGVCITQFADEEPAAACCAPASSDPQSAAAPGCGVDSSGCGLGAATAQTTVDADAIARAIPDSRRAAARSACCA